MNDKTALCVFSELFSFFFFQSYILHVTFSIFSRKHVK